MGTGFLLRSVEIYGDIDSWGQDVYHRFMGTGFLLRSVEIYGDRMSIRFMGTGFLLRQDSWGQDVYKIHWDRFSIEIRGDKRCRKLLPNIFAQRYRKRLMVTIGSPFFEGFRSVSNGVHGP